MSTLSENCYTINNHLLLHLPDQVKKYGILSETSAFSFESTMGKLHRLITGSRNIISEVVRKFIQKQNDEKCKSNIDPSINDSIYSLGNILQPMFPQILMPKLLFMENNLTPHNMIEMKNVHQCIMPNEPIMIMLYEIFSILMVIIGLQQ